MIGPPIGGLAFPVWDDPAKLVGALIAIVVGIVFLICILARKT
jgi:hypothetical protein